MQNLLPILAKVIIDFKPSNSTLSSNFVDDECISEDARIFRTILIQILAKRGMDMSEPNRCIRDNKVHLSVTKDLERTTNILMEYYNGRIHMKRNQLILSPDIPTFSYSSSVMSQVLQFDMPLPSLHASSK
jgi:hypothetical protein